MPVGVGTRRRLQVVARKVDLRIVEQAAAAPNASLGRSYAAEAVLLESLIAPLYLCMHVTVEALEDWRYVDAIDRVLEAFGLAGAAWHPVRDAEAP